MIDIYSFLNSRDIAEHCRKIQKEWSPLEMALIISNSNRSRPISDKHEAWRELISDYPDMPVPPVPDCYFSRGFDSLHEILLAENRLPTQEVLSKELPGSHTKGR